MEKPFFGMYTQAGDDALVPLVNKAAELQPTASQLRTMLVQFALRNPMFEEATSEVVFNNVLNAVRGTSDEVSIDIVIAE